jgi:peptide-methionine (S)-S-oxide reductase
MKCTRNVANVWFLLLMMCFSIAAIASFVQKAQAGPDQAKSSGRDLRETNKNGEHKKMEKAFFGAGCFWGVEETFRQTPGVTETAVGYAGGTTKNPTYKDVCSGTSGHTETVEVDFDPGKVSYDKLLDVFFDNHDPTTPNRQGPDHGYQYRSVIFYTTEAQEQAAKAAKERLSKSGKFASPIVTAIEPAKEFHRAEEYHQRYLEKNGIKACH